jgi:uncharacterized protein YjbJ (UPF0337 family)
MWNKDEAEGKGKQIKGTIKDKVGEVTGNRDLEAEGENERTAGNVQQNIGEARRKVGNAIEDLGDKIAGR